MRADLDMGSFRLTNVGANVSLPTPTFVGDSTISNNGSLVFNNGAAVRSPISNRLSLHSQASVSERIAINDGGYIMLYGPREGVFGTYGDIVGSGAVRIVAAGAFGNRYALTTYDDNDYTAAQFVRLVSGSTVQVGSITCNVSSTSYNTSSDRRLKVNISPSGDAGSLIDAVQIVSYDFKAGGHVRFGVIAQDLNEVFPEAVTPGKDDGPWSWDASKLVALLIKEIQSLRARVSGLEGQ